MKNKIIYIILLIFITNSVLCQKHDYKLSNEQKKIIKQAKSLESSGLLEESKNIYINLLKNYPFIDEAFNSLKKIELLNDNIDKLIPFSNNYIKAHNYNESKLINVFEIYLLTDSTKATNVINRITNKSKPNLYNSTKIISILLKYNKINEVVKILDRIRKDKKNNSFYSLQMGMYFSLENNIIKAIEEYFIYLNNNDKNINIISNRIMTLADNESNINTIKNTLNANKQIQSKIILSQLEFKLKNFETSYQLLDKYSDNDQLKILFIEDLLEIEKFNLSEKIINSIITNSKNKKTITKAIFLLAQLFEKKIVKQSNRLPISRLINNNEILNSPYIKINEEYATLLENTTNIYDSLSINLKDYKSTFHLAEIKYRIQGDLDGALILYTDIFNKEKTFKYRMKSLERIIDIYHSKGNLEEANAKIEKYSNINNEEIKMILNIKKIQNSFYMGNKELVLEQGNQILKNLSKENSYYNDILDIISMVYFIEDDDEFKKYSLSKFKLMQNKRVISINLLNSLESKSNEFNDRVVYEKSYLNILQGQYNLALDIINNIDEDSIYAEHSILLKGEILDYIIKNKSQAVDSYILFLDLFPDSIYYDLIRLRIREIANADT